MDRVRRVPMTRSRAKELANVIDQSNNASSSTNQNSPTSKTAAATTPSRRAITNRFRCVPSCRRGAPDPTSSAGLFGLDTVQCRRCKCTQHASCAGLSLPQQFTQKYEQKVAEDALAIFVCCHCLKETGIRNSLTSSGSISSSPYTSKKKSTSVAAAAAAENSNPELTVSETPDRRPADVAPFEAAIAAARSFLRDSGFKLIFFPAEKLTAAMEKQILECSQSSVSNATFSEAYPRYCVDEIKSGRHPYLQGAAAVHVASNKIVAVALSNGRDPYCDLRRTVDHLKEQITKGLVKLVDDGEQEGEGDDVVDKTPKRRQRNDDDGDGGKKKANDSKPQSKATKQQSASAAAAAAASSVVGVGLDSDITVVPNSHVLLLRGGRKLLTERLRDFTEFDSVVHFTFIVTHDEFRGKRLASTLLWAELARWAMRGRQHACVNMALEKLFDDSAADKDGDDDADDEGGDGEDSSLGGGVRTGSGGVQCRISDASRRLYSALKFVEVYPRYHADGSLRWTKKEEEAGRMMLSLDFTRHFSVDDG